MSGGAPAIAETQLFVPSRPAASRQHACSFSSDKKTSGSAVSNVSLQLEAQRSREMILFPLTTI